MFDTEKYIGKNGTEVLKELHALGMEARLSGPHMIITADYHPGRINLSVDENNVIVEVHFG